MVARRNLDPRTSLGSTIARLRDQIQHSQTRPHGLKVAEAGEGLELVATDGSSVVLDAPKAAEWDSTTEGLALAEGEISAAVGRLETAEADLDAAADRLDAAERDLYSADGRVAGAYQAVEDAETRLAAADAALAARAGDLETWSGTAKTELSTLTTNLSTAQDELDQAEANLAALTTRTTAAEGRISTAETNLSTVETNLSTTAAELSTLETTVGDVQGAVEAAQATATTADGKADQAITDAATAASAASTAQQAAAAADQKALDAAGLAGSKGEVIYQATAPTGTRAAAQNLWVRTSDNKPHTYNGTTWVAVTDKTATDAAAAAAAAQGDATKALTNAAAADQKAADAMTAAGNAMTAANGKNTVSYATTAGAPPTTGRKSGDIHWVVTSASPYNVTEQWRFNGSAWFKANLDSTVIAALDVGKLTGVFADISKHLSAGSISSNLVMIGTGGNLFPDPTLTAKPIRDNIPDAWENPAGTAWDGNGASFTLPAGTIQTGAYFGASTGNIAGRMAVTAGASYHVSARVKLGAAMTHKTGVALYSRVYKSGTSTFGWATPQTIYLDFNQFPDKATAPADTWLKVSGTVKIPDGYDQLVIGLYVNGHTGTVPAVTWSNPTVEPAADGRLIVDGSVTAKAVDAESVAAAVGSFVKVKADNVEVTESLATKVFTASNATMRNLVVTGSTTLDGETWARDLAAEEITAATINVEQLAVTGTGTFSQAVVDKLYSETFATRKLYAEHVVIASGYNLLPNGRGEVADRRPINYSDVYHGADSTILSGSSFPGYFWTKSNVGKITDRIPVKAGARYLLKASTRAELAGQSAYWQVRWIGANNTLVSSEYLESNVTVGPTWTHFTPVERVAPAGAETVYFSLYGNHTNGTQGGTAYWSGLEIIEMTSGELIVDGAITAKKLTITEEMASPILNAGSVTAKTGVFTVGLEAVDANLLGTTVAESLNVTKKLTARDAIINGTLDVEQLNVTEAMATPILNAGSVTAKKGVFTEGLTAADASLVGTTLAEKIDAQTLGTKLLTAKAIQTSTASNVGIKITDAGIVAWKPADTVTTVPTKAFEVTPSGVLTLQGTFRTAPVGEPGLVLAHRAQYAGGAQLGAWFAHDGTAPGDPGDTYGTTAGLWVDTGGLSSSSYYPLNIRGMNSAGLKVWGNAITLQPSGTSAWIETGAGKRMEVRGGTGGLRIWQKLSAAQGGKPLEIWSDNSMDINTYGGGMNLTATGGILKLSSDNPIEMYSGFVMTTKATDGWVVQSGGNFALRNMSGQPMTNSGTGTTLVLGEYGRIYKNSSSIRYKTDLIERTSELDELYLETPVWEWTNKEAKARAEALRDAPRPLTQDQEADLRRGSKRDLGTIAELAMDTAPELIAYNDEGLPESYRYELDGTKLRPFVRELWKAHKADRELLDELRDLLPILRDLTSTK